MDASVLADQQGLTYISSVWTQDVVWRTFQDHWMIGLDGKRESEKSMLSVQLDDDDAKKKKKKKKTITLILF